MRKLRLASSRCSDGEPTDGELESALCDCESPERPRVKRDGRAAMAAGWVRAR